MHFAWGLWIDQEKVGISIVNAGWLRSSRRTMILYSSAKPVISWLIICLVNCVFAFPFLHQYVGIEMFEEGQKMHVFEPFDPSNKTLDFNWIVDFPLFEEVDGQLKVSCTVHRSMTSPPIIHSHFPVRSRFHWWKHHCRRVLSIHWCWWCRRLKNNQIREFWSSSERLRNRWRVLDSSCFHSL